MQIPFCYCHLLLNWDSGEGGKERERKRWEALLLQEHGVTVLLNLSLYKENKAAIVGANVVGSLVCALKSAAPLVAQRHVCAASPGPAQRRGGNGNRACGHRAGAGLPPGVQQRMGKEGRGDGPIRALQWRAGEPDPRVGGGHRARVSVLDGGPGVRDGGQDSVHVAHAGGHYGGVHGGRG